jgi:SAM-dependent methyltransferase
MFDLDFDEAAYLEANPDVAIAVRSGVFSSGAVHYDSHGRSEGRRLRATTGSPDWLINPPFSFNAPGVSEHSPEVSGRIILKSMLKRLGWVSFGDKRVLDFGCGVRFARTIVNLEIEIGHYAGVDTNQEPVRWLQDNVHDSRLAFHHLDMRNPMYNPDGSTPNVSALQDLGLNSFDVACMFSVITHQDPVEAELIFKMLRPIADRLYFTALIDDSIDGYTEKDSVNPRHMSCFSTNMIENLLKKAGWKISSHFPPAFFQQSIIVAD